MHSFTSNSSKLTVGTAQYIIMTHDIALALMTSERAPVVIPPISDT